MRFSFATCVLLFSIAGCSSNSSELPGAYTCDEREGGGVCNDFLTGYEDMSKADRESHCEGTTLMTPCPTVGVIAECEKNLLANKVHLVQRYYEAKAPHTMETLEAMCTNNSGAWRVPGA